MSQDRLSSESAPVRSATFQAPNIESTLNKVEQVSQSGKVRVVHGANQRYFDRLDGKTVGTVRKSLKEVFNIPGDATALVNGQSVGDNYILESNQTLEFVKEAGVKGFFFVIFKP